MQSGRRIPSICLRFVSSRAHDSRPQREVARGESMESALDMLSRAATLVQTSDIAEREAALRRGMTSRDSPPLMKRTLDRRDSPPKELPSKMVRIQRLRDQKELPQALGFDEGHMERFNNRKCAGTQTPFSNLNTESLTVPTATSSLMTLSSSLSGSSTSYSTSEPYHVHSSQPLLLDLDKSTAALRASSSSSSASSAHDIRIKREADEQLSPLNLSNGASSSINLSNGQSTLVLGNHGNRSPSSLSHSNGSISSRGQNSSDSSSPVDIAGRPHRPSVITCASTVSQNTSHRVTVNDCGPRSVRHANGGDEMSAVSHQGDVTSGMCGSAVEEHFRRSLGRIYPQSISPVLSSSPAAIHKEPTPPLQNDNTASVSGAVDDHFARSLGEKWSQIKVRTESPPGGVFSDTVDDHFTKALGETWLRIKAKQNCGNGSRDSTPSPCNVSCPPQAILH